MPLIPYGRQSISDSDIESVIRVLQSDYLTQGPQVPAFENIISSYVGAQYSVAVNSATSALHIACIALDLKPGDWLWTTPISFVASANCALYCGAHVDFVDIDPSTFNMSTQALSEKLAIAEKVGKLPKIVIPVHFAGQSCDMEEISSLANKYGFKVIEDASHAIGGRWKNNFIGSCKYSDVTIFSFHPVKIITTGEGGLLTTLDANIAERLANLRSHGITRDLNHLNQTNQGSWYYEQQSLGFNYRMTDIQAALGISQMTRINDFITRRHQLATRYNQSLVELPIITPWQDSRSYSAFHLYVIQTTDKCRIDRRQLFDMLRAAGIMVNVHYIPIHLQPYYLKMGFKTGDFPNAETYYSRAISIPLYASLTESEQDYVIDRLTEFLK